MSRSNNPFDALKDNSGTHDSYTFFFETLAALNQSGLSIRKIGEALGSLYASPDMKPLIEAVTKDMETQRSLAPSQHPRVNHK